MITLSPFRPAVIVILLFGCYIYRSVCVNRHFWLVLPVNQLIKVIKVYHLKMTSRQLMLERFAIDFCSMILGDLLTAVGRLAVGVIL